MLQSLSASLTSAGEENGQVYLPALLHCAGVRGVSGGDQAGGAVDDTQR